MSVLDGLVSEAKKQRVEAAAARLLGELAAHKPVYSAMPLLLEFTSNNLCNLKCVMCRPNGLAPQQLPEGLVKAVLVDQLMPDALVLLPSAGSEPFLGDIEELTDGCLKHEVQLFLITNGTLMTREKLERLAPVLGRLHVSVDGHRADLYEKIRVGGKFDKLVENLKMAGQVAQVGGFEMLMSTVYSIEMVDEVDDYIRFAASVGADAVEFQRIRHATEEAKDLDPFLALDPARIERSKARALKAAEEEGLDVHLAFWPTIFGGFNQRVRRRFLHNDIEQSLIREQPNYCYMAATYMKVLPDGRVQPCCAAGDNLYMGNIKEQSVAEIWNGEKFQELRRSLYAGQPPKVCQTCPNYKRHYEYANGDAG